MNRDIICGLDIGSSKICATCGRIDSAQAIDILACQAVPTQGLKGTRIVEKQKLINCFKQLIVLLRQRQGVKLRRVYVNLDLAELKTGQIKSSLEHLPAAKELNDCLKKAGLTVEGIVPSGLAQALGLFRNFNQDTAREQILIDVGAGLVKFTLMEAGQINDIALLPRGAQEITNEIAAKLNLSLDCAEQLKKQYGRAHYPEPALGEKIIVRDKTGTKIIQPQNLNMVICANVDLLLQQMKEVLFRLNYKERYSRIYLTGGGSILEGFLERAEQVLEKPVKMGFLYAVRDSRIQTQSAIFSTSVGLIHFGYQRRLNKRFWTPEYFSPIRQLANRARALYREYF